MHHDVVNSRPLGWVIVQNFGDQVTGTVRDRDILGEIIRVHSDPLVGSLDVRRLKGWLANDESVNDDTDGPDIHLIRVTLLALEHLRSDIVGSTANGALSLTIELKLGGETEIADLDLHLVVEEEVTQLQISMDDAMTVKVLHSGADLVDIALDFELVQSLTSAQKLVK